MSIVLFELTEDHIKVLRNLGISIKFFNETLLLPAHAEDNEIGANIYDEINLILNGNIDSEYHSLDDGPIKKYGPLKLAEFNKLLLELPTALDIILYTGKFEPGKYKTKFDTKDWKKVD